MIFPRLSAIVGRFAVKSSARVSWGIWCRVSNNLWIRSCLEHHGHACACSSNLLWALSSSGAWLWTGTIGRSLVSPGVDLVEGGLEHNTRLVSKLPEGIVPRKME